LASIRQYIPNIETSTKLVQASITSEHLPQCSVCDSALEISFEVHRLNPVNPLEDYCDPEKNAHLLRALEEFNKHNQIVFIDFSMLLIG
jgi:hypothetical protein